MKKLVALTGALLLVIGMAFAQQPNDIASGSNYRVGTNQAMLVQPVTVTIPQRVALHVDTANWILNLNDLAQQACFPVSKSLDAQLGGRDAWSANFPTFVGNLAAAGTFDTDTSWTDGVRDAVIAAHAGIGVGLATSYPAVNIDGVDGVSGDGDKGYIVCYFGKVMQKFANVPWRFEAQLNSLSTSDPKSFGQFGIADVLNGVVVGSGTNSTGIGLLASGDHTGGWLDDYLVEALYFDGTEDAGTHLLFVQYTLTADL